MRSIKELQDNQITGRSEIRIFTKLLLIQLRFLKCYLIDKNYKNCSWFFIPNHDSLTKQILLSSGYPDFRRKSGRVKMCSWCSLER